MRIQFLAVLPLAAAVVATAANAQSAQALENRKVDFTVASSRHDVSPPLRDMKLIPPSTVRKGRPVREHRIPFEDGPELDADPLLANTAGNLSPQPALPLAPTVGSGVDGVGKGFTGPAGAFSVNSAPPDTTGAVGATQFVQWVNSSFAIFD